MSELVGVGAKVETLLDEAEKQGRKIESQATQIASLEIKAATSGKLGLSEMVKIGGLVISLTLVISSLIQVFVKSSQAEALQELRKEMATAQGDLSAARDRVRANEEAIAIRAEWVQATGNSLSDVSARITILERAVESSTGSRWTADDHRKYDALMQRELEMLREELKRVDAKGGQE